MRKQIFALLILLLVGAGMARADTFNVTSTASTPYSANSQNQVMACQNLGAQTIYLAPDGSTATTTNGIAMQPNGGCLNISPATRAVSAITSSGSSTLVCLPGVQLSGGSCANATSSNVTVFTGSANAVVSTSVANFFPINSDGTAVAAASEGAAVDTLAVSATIANLNCFLVVANGTKTVAGGTNYVIAVRKNLADSAVTCTITAAITNCQDATHTLAVAAGDELDFGITPNGTPTALIPVCSVTVSR